MTVQGDLFAGALASPALPQGMTLWPEFVSLAEEAELARHIDAAPLAPFKFHQWEGKRLTASFGQSYDFSKGRLEQAPPFPDWLRVFADRAGEQAKAGPFAHALLIRYDPGAGIGWHRDRPQFATVLGLSLTSEVQMRLRRRTERGFERLAVPLPPRSLYRLTGPARWEWEHSILPVAETRRSITLRTLREGGGAWQRPASTSSG